MSIVKQSPALGLVAWQRSTLSAGWRRTSNRAGLADLRRLHEQAARARKQAEAAADRQASAACPPSPLERADEQLFAQATRAVQPLGSGSSRLLHKPARDGDRQQLTERRQRAVGSAQSQSEEVSDGAVSAFDSEPAWTAPGIGPDVLRQLQKAFWPIGAQLDLHGMTREQARPALVSFIASSQTFGTRCVCIIHGKGYGSAQGEPVLAVRVRQWLKQLPAVSAFAAAPPSYGGSGALLALIRLP